MDESDEQQGRAMPDAGTLLTHGLLRKRRSWTVLVFILFGLSTWPIAHYVALLRTDNAIESWLGNSDPAVKAYQQFSQEFHANELLVVAIDNCQQDDSRLELLANRLEQHDAIVRCMTANRMSQMMGVLSTETKSNPLVGKKSDFSGIFAEVQADSNTDRKALLTAR